MPDTQPGVEGRVGIGASESKTANRSPTVMRPPRFIVLLLERFSDQPQSVHMAAGLTCHLPLLATLVSLGSLILTGRIPPQILRLVSITSLLINEDGFCLGYLK